MKPVIPALLLTFFLTGVVGCNQQSSAPASSPLPPPAVVTSAVKTQSVALGTHFVGKTEAVAKVDLRARVQGFLKASHVQEGRLVEAGTLMYEIEPDRYEAQKAQAVAQVSADRARLADARAKLQRLEQLSAKKLASRQDLDAAKATEQAAIAALQVSQAKVQQAELDLSYTRIEAPITGFMGASAVDVGNLVGGDGAVLSTLVDLSAIDVTIHVSDKDYLAFRKQSAEESPQSFSIALELSDGEHYPHSGEVRFVGNQIDDATGTLPVTLRFPNPDTLLRPGMFVNVRMEKAQQNNSLVVPQSAVQSAMGGYSVLVVGTDNLVEQRSVTLGPRIDNAWVVLSGLNAGEHVIIEGLQKAKPGSAVTPVQR